uniref:Uncharacterized protein n=1 Tax=Panagrolaimus sp. PS1159 TaxID=55785 RepID=A0AC35EZ37_9BILA
MFISLTFLLLFITPTNSRPNNYFTNETTRANESNETLPMLLTDDSSNVAIQRDNDVELIGRGSVDLILMDRTLDVKIDLYRCKGPVKFCYSSLDKNGKAASLCGNGFCGFDFYGRDTDVDLMGLKDLLKSNLDQECEQIRMKRVETSYCGQNAASCEPLTGEGDKKITIIVQEASSNCHPLIKNARIYYPPTTTTSTSLPSTKSPSETSNASTEWYIWVIIGVVFGLLIGIIIAIFGCWKKQICLFQKKSEAKKRITMTDTVDPQIITKAEDAPKRTTITDTVETGIVTKVEDFPELKLDPKPESKPEAKPKTKTTEEIAPPPKAAKKSKKKPKKSKKAKKQKTPVKKDTKDDPIPLEAPFVDVVDLVTLSKEPDSVATPPPPPPQVASSGRPLSEKEQQLFDEDYYTPKKMKLIKSTSSKSGASNRKSIGSRPIVIKMKLEPHYSSLRRWKYSSMEDGKWKEFEQHYKVDPKKKPLDVEVSLLSGYIGDIFVTINRLIQESETSLKEKGAEFRGNGKAAKKFPESVYKYLEDPETPEYIRYTAMGSEIENGVFLDETEFGLYSLSALLLIGFTTSIPDK